MQTSELKTLRPRRRVFITLISDEDAALFGFKGELIAEIGVRYSDELAGALAEASAAKVSDAVLGDDIINIIF